ncbi:MAG: hypothetical protein ACFE9S_15220 [Candidatus Hermodarchaeota archaeon]
MRKSIPILVCLLGIFFFMPFINFSRAAPPDYIGVQVGEEYYWTFNINVNTFTQFAADMNQTVPPELSMFATMGGIQMKGEIAWISDEAIDVYNYVIVNVSIFMQVPGYGWQQFPEPGTDLPVLVLNNETSNYFNNTINAMNVVTFPPSIGIPFPFMIVPHNLNWTLAIDGLLDLMSGFTGGMTGITLEEYGRGFKITVPEQLVNGTTVRETTYMAQWNEKGVFGSALITYGGSPLISVNIDISEIPGYEIGILIGVLGVSTVGIIYYIKKRK